MDPRTPPATSARRRALLLAPALGLLTRHSSAQQAKGGAVAPRFDLQGHRGARGLAPENTLAGFELAMRLGVTTLEMDASITADGVVVVSHDAALNPQITRDAQGRWLERRGPLIRSLTLAQLREFDVGRIAPGSGYARSFPDQQPQDGARIPTLAEVFALVRRLGAGQMRFDIDTKVYADRPDDTLPPEQFVRALLAVIDAAGMADRVMIQSFDWRTLAIVRRLKPAMDTMALTTQGGGFDNIRDERWTAGLRLQELGSVPAMVRAVGGTIWAPAHEQLSPEGLQQARALGLKVIPWTVNESAAAERLIDWGVDGIISDRPDRIRAVMAGRGMALPPVVAPET